MFMSVSSRRKSEFFTSYGMYSSLRITSRKRYGIYNPFSGKAKHKYIHLDRFFVFLEMVIENFVYTILMQFKTIKFAVEKFYAL